MITDIILTHHHPDHVDGLPSLEKVLNPSKLRVWKIPNQHSCDTWSSLKHLQRFSLSSSSSPEEYLQVRHTPGHTSDSICLLWYRDSNLQAIFTADTVLGHGSAVFENLSEYMASLTLLEGVLTAAQGKVPLYPGHGEVRRDGLDTVKEYKKHRIEREEQIVRSLRVDGPATVDE